MNRIKQALQRVEKQYEIYVDLSDEELLSCRMIAEARLKNCDEDGFNHCQINNNKEKIDAHLEGVIGEVAFSKLTGIPLIIKKWTKAMYLDRKHPERGNDVGIFEVRATLRMDGGLCLQKSDLADKPNSPFVLAKINKNRIYFPGWFICKDGTVPEYWKGHIAKPCFIVPSHKLRTMNELFQLFNLPS